MGFAQELVFDDDVFGIGRLRQVFGINFFFIDRALIIHNHFFRLCFCLFCNCLLPFGIALHHLVVATCLQLLHAHLIIGLVTERPDVPELMLLLLAPDLIAAC